tara:strand:+ start:4969 stop:5565 length:597 start_codon:yes stop_codon:yes gene_type:complete
MSKSLRITNYFIFFLLSKMPLNSVYGADQKGGMPQLDPTSFNSQIFWLVIIFSFLFILINYIFLPKISGIKRNREDLINYNLNVAKENNIKIEKVNKEITRLLEESRAQSEMMIKECQDKNSKFFNEEVQKVVKELHQKEKVLLSNLQIMEDQVKKDIIKYSKDLVVEIYKQILSKNTDIKSSDFKQIEIKNDRKSFS